jgi:hypothetical protein
MLARVCTTSSLVREKEREREGEREGERGRERESGTEKEKERERCKIWLLNLFQSFLIMAELLFLFLKGMTGALAPLSYLVQIKMLTNL